MKCLYMLSVTVLYNSQECIMKQLCDIEVTPTILSQRENIANKCCFFFYSLEVIRYMHFNYV